MTADQSSANPNRLYFGDNLDILREHVADESVDLIYLDPPFNSNATYNVLFRERSGEESAAQITAFEDTWHWGWESETAFQDVVTRGPEKVGSLLAALRQFLGQNDMMAYLTMMAQRMIELHRVLKPTGSIYLHCDPTASHYLKLLMDAVFHNANYRNEIVWKRTSAHSDVEQGARHMGRIHDTILMYSKGADPLWNTVYVLTINNTSIRFIVMQMTTAGGIRLSHCTPQSPGVTLVTNGKASSRHQGDIGRSRKRIWNV